MNCSSFSPPGTYASVTNVGAWCNTLACAAHGCCFTLWNRLFSVLFMPSLHIYYFLKRTFYCYLVICIVHLLSVFTFSHSGSSTIRLVGGTTPYEGRVEVYRNRQWQTVCDDLWGISEAQVVCRQLGYGSAVSALRNAYFGRGSGAQWEVNWYCSGNESSLQSCRTSSSSCGHYEDASVRCFNSSGELKVVHCWMMCEEIFDMFTLSAHV